MRSKLTNFLQAVALATGIIYLILGVAFYFDPLLLSKLFRAEVSPEWLTYMRFDLINGTMYFILKALAVLLTVTGLSMVVPLFDPLKYRILIVFNGFVFPVIASITLLVNGVLINKTEQGTAVNVQWPIFIIGLILLIIAILTGIGLLLTREQARAGKE